MKKIITLLFLVFSSAQIFAQQIDTIQTTDKAEFVKTLIGLIDDTKRTELKDLTKNFGDDYKKGVYNEAFVADLAIVTNKMIVKKGKAYPQLSGVLENFVLMYKLNLDKSKWDEWMKTLIQVSDNAKNGESKNILDFLEFTYPLHKDNALNVSASKTWYFVADKFKLKYSAEGPIVELELSMIQGITKGDTILIQNTLGTYNYNDKTWYGLHGAMDWERAGLPKKEVFCTFGDYTINMNTQSYEVDSVIFSYKNYFSTDIKGRLSDKLVTNNSEDKTNYPKFTAIREDVPLQKISPNVIYDGGFTLAGAKILGEASADDRSSLSIFMPGTNILVVKAYFNTITINKPINVFASDAEVSIYFGKDSIYHPKINLQFDLEKNALKLVKGEGSLAATKFSDSYHKVELDADILEWDLAKRYIDINTVSTSGLKASTYESYDFFNSDKIREVRGNVSYDPLSILYLHQNQTDYNEIMDFDYAKKLASNLTVKQIQPLLFNLVSEGFISWNQETGVIIINSKVKHYVLSNAKKKDYDNIVLVSKTKKQNGRLNLDDNNITIEGISIVPISKATMTEFYPDSNKLILKQNRDMEFNGFFYCGNLDFFGKNNEFKYAEFIINTPEIDTMIINIPDGDKLDEYGKPVLKPLNTVLEGLSGKLEINDPSNKSGKIDKPDYPKLTTNSNSKVYFESNQIRGGTYKRENFFYDLKPFALDSLMQLKPGNLVFEGELNSANIFPKINEPLRVQSDLTLGFELSSPPGGFNVYKGKAKFIDDITLNGEGLSGKGQIQYKTVSFESSNIKFYPDSLLATTDTLGVEKSKGAYESPWVRSANNDIKYYPYQDSLWANSSAKSPFRMYGEVMDLDGTFSVTDKGISGTGTADWDDATLISNHFIFEADEMFADTAQLIIKSLDGDKVTFNTPNVNAAVDFIKYTGYFKSNLDDNRTEFGYNQYETNLDEFFWDINAKRLEFNASEGSEGAPFKSLHKDQDSLMFLVKKADFNLQTSIIEAHGVKEILVADSRIIPEGGEVVINPEAKLNTFKNAVIEANAESKKHRIEKAIVDVLGKNKLRGSGSYVYKTRDTKLQYIDFPSISVVTADSTLITKKKKTLEAVSVLNAKGIISQNEDFILYPNVTFYGNVEMFSSYDKLKIKGFTKIDFKSEFVSSDFYEIDSEVDPENLQMDISKAKDPGGAMVRTGIFVSKSGLNPIYTEILNNQIGPLDIPMIEVNDILSHNYETKTYTFGLEEKIVNPDSIMAGNILEFNPATGAIHAEGALDFGTQYGVIKEKVAGTVDANLNENKYTFNTSLTFPWQFDKDLIERIGFYLLEDNFDLENADYTKKNAQMQLAEFFNDKDLSKAISEIELNGTFAKPKTFKENLMISDLDFVYDNDERSFKSKGKMNLVFVGEKSIHKRISGYVELGHRMGSDYFSIYLKTSLGDWVYLNFDGGATNIQIVTSYEDINNLIESLDIKKRTIKGEEKDQYIVYELGSEQRALDFARRMKQFNNE